MTVLQRDIVIVGGGMVGAALALLLGRNSALASHRIAVIEARPFVPGSHGEPFDPRVVALTEASRQLLDEVGAWDREVIARACPYRHMVVRDSEGTGSVSFDCVDIHRPDLGHIVENSVILGALYRRLAALPAVDVIHQPVADTGRAGDGRPRLILGDGSEVETPLLVAADGANSRVREGFGFSVRDWDYGHTAIVATIGAERGHRHTARQWFTATGPLAFLPLHDGEHCSIVWSQNHDEARRLMALEDDDFCRELTAASEGALGPVRSVSRRHALPLRQRHAAEYLVPGVVLVGDAAHTIHPLAGQGVNLGLADVQTLMAEIARGLERGLAAGDESVLRRYQRRRKPANLAMMAAMEGFKRLFAARAPWLRVARNAGMTGVDGLLPVKKQLIRRAMGF